MLAAYTIAVNWLGGSSYPARLIQDAGAAGACGSIVLGLLLVFRTNSAYERWSEGRKLWGDLAGNLRIICLKIQSFGGELSPKAGVWRTFDILRLRPQASSPEHQAAQPLPGVGVVDDNEHLPLYIAGLINQRIASWLADGKLDKCVFETIDPRVNALVEIAVANASRLPLLPCLIAQSCDME